jgi:hypothetical protein
MLDQSSPLTRSDGQIRTLFSSSSMPAPNALEANQMTATGKDEQA